ncbi:hypothetical protein DL766_005858 [Monosporascus sp. MC13-8B]|uniref:Altered inheritance of mitochondria protein 11 n=1 Tax=Monosporascus cannonballus TaxID=155416 RepID=A0ABY0GU84_9PEZI|nr:hypothetical protein DL762_009247 [Monosporascus cannonballus]RYO79104.1 hypothetical protein DL763_009410 [Monosporascus cannonballus]RYP28468.1 hypothetical protein DL766_005858 [Monosporascus sp. MC13-8B]
MTIAKEDNSSKSSPQPAVQPAAQSAAQPPSEHSIPVASPVTGQDAYTRPPIFSQRSMKQLGLFFAGAGFLSLSVLATRRAITRKRLATIPKFYHPSNGPVNAINSDSSLIALEALNLATVNVMGFGIMCTGGIAWAFDISSVDDLRRMARGHIGPSGGHLDEEAEREVAEWITTMLPIKELKEQEGGSSPKKNG